MKFLEAITAFGDNILIPINRIKCISIRYTTGWEIYIVGDDVELSECFGKDEEKLNKRYEIIRYAIED